MKVIKIKYWTEIPDRYTGIAEFTNGSKQWYKEGKKHREDGPAVEHSNGYKEWWFEGKLHRTDGPAKEYVDGSKYWYLEGKRYSEINLNNYVVLDSYKGPYNLTWYKLLDKDEIFECPDIPGLIEK